MRSSAFARRNGKYLVLSARSFYTTPNRLVNFRPSYTVRRTFPHLRYTVHNDKSYHDGAA